MQVMERMNTLNKEHRDILKRFDKRIDKFIYDITEEYDSEAFNNFMPLKTKALTLHNILGRECETSVTRGEWIFMLPNFLLFGAVGFSTALKTKLNTDEIDDLCDELFVYMSTVIKELDKMLDQFENDEDTHDAYEYIKNNYKNKQQ